MSLTTLSSAILDFTFPSRSQGLLYIREVATKISIFQEQGSQGIAEKVRKGLPKLRWRSKKQSKECGSRVFARDSEVEREEL